jgi:ComF family protein
MTLGEILARPMASIIPESGWNPDLLVPVPLGAAHQSQRGYNQAALLGRPVALANGINYSTRALHKVRETPTQVGLKYSERFQNVADAFKAESKIVAERNIVVVDDVTTSGATMEACAVALMAAGARNIYGLTLARSSYQMGGNIVGNFW